MKNSVKIELFSGPWRQSYADEDEDGKALVARLEEWCDRNFPAFFGPDQARELARQLRLKKHSKTSSDQNSGSLKLRLASVQNE